MHANHTMHRHSLELYPHIQQMLDERSKQIYAFLSRTGPMSDRRVMAGLGFVDPNAVRSQITRMVQKGVLVECEPVIENRRKVRQVKIPPMQMELI